ARERRSADRRVVVLRIPHVRSAALLLETLAKRRGTHVLRARRANPELIRSLERYAGLPRRLVACSGVARKAIRLVEVQPAVEQRNAELDERLPHAVSAGDVPLAREKHRARVRIA